jgi:hypothetical protein
MWVDKTSWLAVNNRVIAAEAVRAQLERHNIALEASLDWMRLRLSQIEHERAQLLYRFMDIKVDVPEITRRPTAPSKETGAALLSTLDFNDVGDAEAKRLGIGWDTDGTVRFNLPE